MEDGGSLFSGCGASTLPPEEVEKEEEEAKPAPDPYVVRKGYSKTPTLPDQYQREGLWDRGPSQVKTFHLGKAEDLAVYNKLLTRAQPEGSPGLVLEANTPVFCEKEADFIVFFMYREILYKNLSFRNQ